MNQSKANLFIVGAAKAGTTSVYDILSSANEVRMCRIKELHFFANDIVLSDFRLSYRKKYSDKEKGDKLNSNQEHHDIFGLSTEEYEKLFSGLDNYKYRGEASTSYLYSQNAAANIKEYNPHSKIIIVLRNPIERAYSHYKMNRMTGDDLSMTFSEALESDFRSLSKGWGRSHLYVELSLYYCQVKRYLDLFGTKNVLLLKFDDLKNDQCKVAAQLNNFLGVNCDCEIKNHSNESIRYNHVVLRIMLNLRFLKTLFPKAMIRKFKSFLPRKNFGTLDYDSIPLDIVELINEDQSKLKNLITLNNGNDIRGSNIKL